jgi:homoserine/homoserine lactone efflux protein
VVIVALGVGVLVASSPVAFNVIRYSGAAYLIYLGFRQFFSKPGVEESRVAVLQNESAFSIFRRGFWVNLLNPKAIIFFLAFTPQFIRPEQPLFAQYAVLTATIVAIDILVMWFFFAAAARSFERFTRGVRGQLILNRTFGVLFVAVGILLALLH